MSVTAQKPICGDPQHRHAGECDLYAQAPAEPPMILSDSSDRDAETEWGECSLTLDTGSSQYRVSIPWADYERNAGLAADRLVTALRVLMGHQ